MTNTAAVPHAQGGALVCRALAEDDAGAALRAVDAYRESRRAPEIATACEDSGRLLATTAQVEARALFEKALATYKRLAAVRD